MLTTRVAAMRNGRRRTWQAIAATCAVALSACTGDSTGETGTAEPVEVAQPAGTTAASVSTPPVGEDIEFCQVLAENLEAIATQTASADRSAGAQLALLLSNIDSTNRMLDDLADVAPDEIADDMTSVVEAWNEQFDAVSEAAGDPKGAFGALLVSALLSAGSFERVDIWSRANCGSGVFEVAATSVGNSPCEWLPSGGDPDIAMAESFDSSAAALRVVESLELIAERVPDASTAANDLLDAIRDQDPPATRAREALGRLRYDTTIDGDALLRSVSDSVQELCFVPAFVEPGADYFNAGPFPQPGGSIDQTTNLWDICGASGQGDPIADESVYFPNCSATVHLPTGTVTWLTPPPRRTANQSTYESVRGPATTYRPYIQITPAAGLDPEQRELVIEAQSLLSAESPKSLAVPQLEEGELPDFEFLSFTPNRALLHIRSTDRFDSFGYVTLLDLDLQEVARIDTGPGVDVEVSQVTESVVALFVADGAFSSDGPERRLLLDMRTGAINELDPAGGRRTEVWESECRDRAVFEITDSGVEYLVLEQDEGVRIESLVLADNGPREPVRPDVLFGEIDGVTGATDSLGTPLWTLDRSDLGVRAAGGWIVAVNTEGEQLILDPRTGDLVDSLPSDVTSALYALSHPQGRDHPESASLDPVSGRFWVVGQSVSSETERLNIRSRTASFVESEGVCVESAAESNAAIPTPAAVIAPFHDEFIAATRSSDLPWLVDRLHPAVLEIWTREQCLGAFQPADWFPEGSTIDTITSRDDSIVDFGNGDAVDLPGLLTVRLANELTYTVSLDPGGPYWFGGCATS